MMSLDEAIRHCQERAVADCSECAREHLQLAEWLEELKSYKALEEQGKLLKLRCAVGDTMYTLNTLPNGKTVIGETTVDAFMCALCMLEGRFGKAIFLTAEEAENALEMN